MTTTREKFYQYQKPNGKTITIKRTWTNNNSKANKQACLKKYFEENAEEIRMMKNIKAVYDDYLIKNADNKISYSMLYHYYQSLYNTRKKQEKPKSSSASASESEPIEPIPEQGEPNTEQSIQNENANSN